MPPSLPRPCVAALAFAALVSSAARAQDTTRVHADSARTDTTRARRDTVRAPLPWHIQFDLGFQDVGGNSNLTVFNTVVLLERRQQGDYLLSTKLDVRYGNSSGIEAVNYQTLGLRFDWHPRKLVSPFLGADITRDRVRLIAMRAQGGTGLNFNTDIRDNRRTYFSLGLLFDHEVYLAGVTPGETDKWRWILRASTTRLVGTSTRIEATAKLHPSTRDFSDYLAHVTAAVRVAVTRHLGFTTRYEYRRDSRPALGVLPEDRSLTVALSFSF